MLRQYRWEILSAVVLALFVALPICAALTSVDYGNCAQNQGQYPTHDNDYNKTASVLFPAPNGVRIFWRCMGGYTNANGNAITAASTFLLLIVTGLLGLIAYRQYTTTRAQLRAYVSLEPKMMSLLPDNKTLMFAVFVENHGQTPAFKMYAVAEAEVDEAALKDGAAITIASDTTQLRVATCWPGKEPHVRSAEKELDSVDMAKLATGKYGLFLCGRVDYLDCFGRPQWTTSRHFMSAATLQAHLVTLKNDPNRAPIAPGFQMTKFNNEASP